MANPDETPRTDPWQMRASDADREKYVSVLQNAYAEGRLSHDEYDDRMSSAYQAVTFADLYPLLTDLPVDDPDLPLPPRLEHQQLARFPPPETALSPRSVTVDASPAVAVFSEVRRGGRWVVPAEQTSVAVMGTLKIDLSEALLESGSVTIQAVAVMGEIRIKVPDDVHLEVTGTGVFGEFIKKDKRSADRRMDAPVGSPHVNITGAAILGSVNVIIVPAHEEPGSRVFPQAGGQVGPPRANVPPAVLPPPTESPPNLPPPNLPPAVQPPAQYPAVDQGQAQNQGLAQASDDEPAAPSPVQPPAQYPAVDKGQAQNQGLTQTPENAPDPRSPIRPPAGQPPGNPQQPSTPDVSESPDPAEPRDPDKPEG